MSATFFVSQGGSRSRAGGSWRAGATLRRALLLRAHLGSRRLCPSSSGHAHPEATSARALAKGRRQMAVVFSCRACVKPQASCSGNAQFLWSRASIQIGGGRLQSLLGAPGYSHNWRCVADIQENSLAHFAVGFEGGARPSFGRCMNTCNFAGFFILWPSS